MGQVPVARVQTLDARFVQVRSSAMLLEPQELSGRLHFIAPKTVEWTYTDGASLSLPPQMLDFIAQAVSGELASGSELFSASWEGSVLTLVPLKKSLKKIFSSISLRFRSDGVAQQVLLLEPTGDSTEILFSHLSFTAL